MCDPSFAYAAAAAGTAYYANRQAKKQSQQASDAIAAMNVRGVEQPGPELDPIAPESEEANKTIRKAKDQEAKRSRLARGQQSTILTNPLGLGAAPETKKQTLIGV
jgi:hypothetical protein